MVINMGKRTNKMTEPTIHEQIDIVLTSLYKLAYGPQSRGRANRIRTQVTALRQLCELVRVQEKKKTLWERFKEWRLIL
jgi:hypothetical protein